MAFEVRISQGKAGDRGGDVYELTDGRVRAEVWPQWGFNCIKWQLRQQDGRWADIIYHMPDWEANPVPTRSGQPILFPFPGRLRDGKLSFEGKTYQLPLTESSKLHSIHGFAPRIPWRVVGSNGGADSASVTGEFSLSKDLPESLLQWPSDFVFQVTYHLFPNVLRVDARVRNPGPGRLPFGLGYHGYFRLPGLNAPNIDTCVLQANAAEIWESENNFPTGKTSPPSAALDFQKPRALGATVLDNAYSKFTGEEAGGGLFEIARLTHPDVKGRFRVLGDRSFRELVLFTPAHRQAIAIEPYTCSADASNLAARGVDSGWRVLEPGAEWEGTVGYCWEPGEL